MSLTIQSLEDVAEVIQLASDTTAAHICEYAAAFKQVPMEEGVTNYFSYSFAKEQSPSDPISILGKISSGIRHEEGNTVGKAIVQVIGLVNEIAAKKQCWHMLMPTRKAENSLGWDFGWIFRTGTDGSRVSNSSDVETNYMIFVQAKNVGAYSSNKAKISFGYGKKNPQSQTFRSWGPGLKAHCQSTVIAGLYVLYGIPECPVAWLTWRELLQFQKAHENRPDKHMRIAGDVVKLVRKRRGVLTSKILEHAFFDLEQLEAVEKMEAQEEAGPDLVEEIKKLTTTQMEGSLLVKEWEQRKRERLLTNHARDERAWNRRNLVGAITKKGEVEKQLDGNKLGSRKAKIELVDNVPVCKFL